MFKFHGPWFLQDLNQPKVEATLPDGLLSVSLLRHQVFLSIFYHWFTYQKKIFYHWFYFRCNLYCFKLKSLCFTENCIGMDGSKGN